MPIFVLLGCVLDATGMGKAIVDFLASLLGHVKAGMSYVLLGSLFVVSGISGSKVSDMATVAPALFPEMRRRGHQAARDGCPARHRRGHGRYGAAEHRADRAWARSPGVSIAGLFQSGFVIAMVLLLALLVLARLEGASRGHAQAARRSPLGAIGRLLLVAAPALVLPFLIRSAVGGGVATATEVSAIAVLYAMIIGQVLYGGISRHGSTACWSRPRRCQRRNPARSSARRRPWPGRITQSGVVSHSGARFSPGCPAAGSAYMAATIVVFVILGCVLEGLAGGRAAGADHVPDRAASWASTTSTTRW